MKKRELFLAGTHCKKREGKMRKVSRNLVGTVCFLLLVSGVSFAGQLDLLVKELVKERVIAPGKAQQILTETKEEMRKHLAKGELETLPIWIQNIKAKGDLRVRYQWEDKGSYNRERERVRFRLGLDAKVNDKTKVGAGLATGSDDPRSTNATLQNTFDTPDIRLDYAYAEYALSPSATLKAGKIKSIKKLIFRPSDLLWDSDINPEGVSLLVHNKCLFMNTGFWVLDENKKTSDPSMFVIQPGFRYKFSKNVSLKLAVAYYGFQEVKGNALEHSEGGNTLEGGTLDPDADEMVGQVLKYDYNSFAPSVQMAIKQPFGGAVPYLAIFGDFVSNSNPSDDNSGYLGGIKFGAKKIKKAGDWQVKYMYRHLEKDAWLDTFPDSDSYSGKTGIEGHEVAFECGLAKHVSLGLDYYSMDKINKSDSNRKVMQVDCKLKF